MAGCGIRLYRFLFIAVLSTLLILKKLSIQFGEMLKLFKKLECMDISGKILRILENMYSEINYSIKVPYELTDSVPSSTWLKRGFRGKPRARLGTRKTGLSPPVF